MVTPRHLAGGAARALPVFLLGLGAARCADDRPRGGAAPEGAPPPPSAVAPARSETVTPPPEPSPRALVLVAGGDVSFGRALGQRLLREPEHNPFATVRHLLETADVRFVNLEGPLSDQRGETESPRNNLVFTGPPAGADALARAGITVVSTANNHAWDYGRAALLETITHLGRVGVRHVGTGRDRREAHAPLTLEQAGHRVAFVAVTDIWNQGPLAPHAAAEHVARADIHTLDGTVRAARAAGADFVIVSYHGGGEYQELPLPPTRAVLRAAVDAGADVILGHHPHVIQGVEWRRERPILYSLGNLLMRMHKDHPWTEMGYLARVTLARGAPPQVEACPFRIDGIVPRPLAREPGRDALERRFFGHLRAVSRHVGGTTIGPAGPDGCAPLSPPNAPPEPPARALRGG